MILICHKYAHDIFTVTMCMKISFNHNPNINLHIELLGIWNNCIYHKNM